MRLLFSMLPFDALHALFQSLLESSQEAMKLSGFLLAHINEQTYLLQFTGNGGRRKETLLEVGIQPHNALLVKVDEHMKLLPVPAALQCKHLY